MVSPSVSASIGLVIAQIWEIRLNPSVLQLTLISKGTNVGMEEPSHCYRRVILYIYNVWQVGLSSWGMVSSLISAWAGLDITRIWGTSLKSKYCTGDIYLQDHQQEYGRSCPLVVYFISLSICFYFLFCLFYVTFSWHPLQFHDMAWTRIPSCSSPVCSQMIYGTDTRWCRKRHMSLKGDTP